MVNNNKKMLLKTVIVSLALISSPALASLHTVQMKSISYDPKIIEIKVGDTLQWINKSYTEHSATSYEDENPASKFDTGLIKPKNTSEKILFKSSGTFLYHCIVHGQSMTGKISVTE